MSTQNDKLAAAQVDFLSCGMLGGMCLYETLHALSHNQDDNINGGSTSISDPNGGDLNPNLDGESHHNEDDLSGPVDGPVIISKVSLGLKKGMHIWNHLGPRLTCQQPPSIPQCFGN